MAEVTQALNLGSFEESFVLHFGGDFSRINAYTLATALVGIADAAKAANSTLNPGYDIEVVVESLGQGSFKAKIKAIYRGAGNLFQKAGLREIVLSVIASYIFQISLAPDPDIKVTVGDSEVVIETGNKKVVVPRQVYDATSEVQKTPEFKRGIAQTFAATEADPSIQSLGISADPKDPRPPIEVPRERFASASSSALDVSINEREFVETTELQIMRAILERSRRRWEFAWRGIRIAAPITDERFYGLFFAHAITIAPGDVLKVRLKVRQKLHPGTNVFVNDANGYEIVEVIEHVPAAKQAPLQ
jgi:hypothetical protein